MLIVTRKAGQRLSLEAPATIEVLEIKADTVRLAVDSPHAALEERKRQERDGSDAT